MAGWELRFEIDPRSALPLFAQIARALTEDVRRGRLTPGGALPGTRTLARSLRVNRNTVAAAYEELQAEGWIVSTPGHGTRISTALPEVTPRRGRARLRGAEPGFEIPEMGAPAVEDEPVTDGALKWDFGIPDVRLAPTQALARAYRRALKERGGQALEYDRYRVERYSRLQLALTDMLRATRALPVSPDELLITRGSQMALYLVARALVGPGDVVAVEDPGYYAAREVFAAAGARVVPLAVDEQGARVDQLTRLSDVARLRAVVLTPHHQFPTTVQLSPGRRVELIRLATRARFAVIEDDYDHEFHYDGRPTLPLASADESRVVVYLGSLSKIFAPGLRVGYVVAPSKLIVRLRRMRRMLDIQDDGILDHALAELFEEGEMQRHLNRARRIYHQRRDLLVQLLGRHLAGALEFTVPAGGIAVWARVNPTLDVERWAERCRRAGLLIRTGRIFFQRPHAQPFVRLGFARLDEDQLRRATRILATSLPS